MSLTPLEILEEIYKKAKQLPLDQFPKEIPDDCLQAIQIIVENAENHRAVLGVTITSTAYKIYRPSQDVRLHQEGMPNGYSGRTFDTKYTTPFMKQHFPHFAMAESAWLTRSLEQPHPYNLNYPGKIQNKIVKEAFLLILSTLQSNDSLATPILTTLMQLLIKVSERDRLLIEENSGIRSEISLESLVDAVNHHIHYDYGKSATGTARLPVLAIYSVYTLLIQNMKRYEGKRLAPLDTHTSPDSRSKSLGDIEILNPDNSCFEVIEIKHKKPISEDMVHTAYRKIKDFPEVSRYYILTTSEPNFSNDTPTKEAVEAYKQSHGCQFILNGVIPSLKYYLRLLQNPQDFISLYSFLLGEEYQRGSAIKHKHIDVWMSLIKQD